MIIDDLITVTKCEDNRFCVATDCLICNRKIVLSLTHTIKETILCEECKKRLRELLYNIGELENLEEDRK